MRQAVRGRAVTLRGLWQHPRSGLWYHRTRRGGKAVLTPLPDLPHDHPDFLAAFIAIARQQEPPTAPKAGTLESTWRAALVSDQFKLLGHLYQAMIRRESALINAKVGTVKASAIQPRHIRANVAEAPVPLARHKAWRWWGTWALERGLVKEDPAAMVKRPKRRASEGHVSWSDKAIADYRARWPIGTVKRAAMELLYWTGLRIGDAVRAGPGMVGKDGVLSIRQQKTGDMAYIPWTCALPPFADPAERDMMLAAIAPLAGQMTFLATRDGRSRSVNGLGNIIAQAAKEAGHDLSAHGLRKARARKLADGGATTHQQNAWTGHQTLAENERYSRDMDRKRAVTGTATEQAVETTAVPSGNQLGK